MIFTDLDWEILLDRIQDGNCTPFIGAGANHPVLPLGSKIANDWADAYKYPLPDRDDLARVAQFVAISSPDQMYPKESIAKRIRKITCPDFKQSPENLLSVLAGLPLPVYMTTNYDDFIVKALEAKGKTPRREMCRWNNQMETRTSVFEAPGGYEPNSDNPLVFHLHGHQDAPESIVLTEDDYLDFLVRISRDEKMLPARIQKALTGASLMFVGYKLADWDFRVLFRGLVTSMSANLRRVSVAVQLPPGDSDPNRQSTQEYLTKYFGAMAVQVYWGTAQQFAKELAERWTKSAR